MSDLGEAPSRAAATAGAAAEPEGARFAELAWLGVLYAVQGLPFGFQASALGVYLRERELSLSAIGFAGALSMPWLLKVLWSPLVDHLRDGPLGPRRSWIVPMQIGLVVVLVAAALLPFDEGPIVPLLVLVFLCNLFTATMDIAVDGLAVDLLRPHQLGRGNAIQVVGYKVGMLLGGGLLLWATADLGWGALFWAMAGLTCVGIGVTLFMREPARAAAAAPTTSIRAVTLQLLATLRRPGALWLVLVITTYKLGESLIDPMFAVMLTDRGVDRELIGLWVGTYGMATSIAGSMIGGLVATRFPFARALVIAGLLRAVPMIVQAAIAYGALPVTAAPAAVAIEHFFGGLLTTVMFAFMMSRVDRSIGASHYTLLATLEVLGKSPPSLLSGVLADGIGLGAAFAVGAGAALSWAVLAAPLSQRATPPAT